MPARSDRRSFLGTLAGATASAALSAAQTGRRRPNVLLIISDDQGYGDLSLHGNPHLKTPNLDRIGREGAQLTHFHVNPVCSPTRACLMTGRYNYRTGVVDTYLGRSMMHPDEVTLPQRLGKAGYRTGIFGKWHLGDNYPLRAMDRGFEESLTHKGGGMGQPSDPPGSSYTNPLLYRNGVLGRHQGYCTDVFVDTARDFITRHRRQPWFAYVATNAPHTPLEIDERWVAPFRAAGLDDTTAKVYGMVANLDAAVGRLLGTLKELDLERDTIVVFLTDNGPQQRRYNADMRGLKGSVYEGGIRVPCFVRWPAAIKPGTTVDRLAAHIDLLPTLLDACGVPLARPAVDGRSLLPLLRGEQVEWPDRTLYFQWHRGDRPEALRDCAALTQRYKLVNGKDLYDLREDPAEKRDIALAQPERVAAMRRGYEQWFQDVSATRGYDPPRIHLGSDHENPVVLTRQDWRGPRAGWEATSLGHWEVEIERDGEFDITLTFEGAPREREGHVSVGGAVLHQPVAAGATECRFGGTRLRRGATRLEASLAEGERSVGPTFVEVRQQKRTK